MTAVATGRFDRLDNRDCIAITRTLPAPVDDVWAAVTESDRLARWIGSWTGDPTEGSVQFSMNAEGEAGEASTWEITDCVPPRRVGVHTVTDYGEWTLVLELADAAGDSASDRADAGTATTTPATTATTATTVTLWHVIDDPSAIENIGPGWEYYLDRLVAAESGGDPNTLDWDRDYYPAMRPHYLAIVESLTGKA